MGVDTRYTLVGGCVGVGVCVCVCVLCCVCACGGPESILLPTRLQADPILDNYCLNIHITDSIRN